jgi:hypothetical protein
MLTEKYWNLQFSLLELSYIESAKAFDFWYSQNQSRLFQALQTKQKLPTFQWYFFRHFNSWPRGAEFLTLLHCRSHVISKYRKSSWTFISMWSWCLIFQSDECCVCMLCVGNVVVIDNPLHKVCGALKRTVCSGRWCVLYAPVEWCSSARTGRNGCWLKLRSRVGQLVAVRQLPGVAWLQSMVAWELVQWRAVDFAEWMPGRGARLPEWRRAAAAPVTQCVGYGRQRVEAASCPVCWAWPPEGRGSHPWRSALPMVPKTGRSGPSVLTGWLMWSLNRLGGHWTTDWVGAMPFILI